MTVYDDVRDWTGDQPDQDTIDGYLTRFDNDPLLAALAILRRRRANRSDAVERFDIDGDYSETRNVRDSLAALDASIRRLEHLTGTQVDDDPLPTVTSVPVCPRQVIR